MLYYIYSKASQTTNKREHQMKKLSQTKRAKAMRKMRRTESASQKETRLHHNKMMKISAQYMYSKMNIKNYRKPNDIEQQALDYRKNK